MSETTIGSLVGFLRLETSDFDRGIRGALAQVDALGAKKVDVKVDADTTAANAKIAATREEVDRLGDSSQNTSGRSRAMVTAILTLGPAIVPIATAATGLGVAFGGMGAAGIAAIVGIKAEMDTGSSVGQKYSATLDGAKTNLQGLARTAAGNVLGSFQQVVGDLNARMPQLNSIIGEMATVTGRTSASLAGGLMAAFVALAPLMRDAAVYVEQLSGRFASLMSGPGVVSFADYVRSVFPQVMAQVENIVGAVIHLIAALAPLGGGTLALISQFATLIQAIPVDVLTVLATLATSVFLGFKTWSALTPLIDGVAGAMRTLQASEEGVATATRGLQAAAGIVGVAIAALSMVFAYQVEQTRKNEQAVNDYADALRASNGVIDDNVRATAAKKLQDDGVLEAARKLGFSLADVTQAALGNGDAMARVAQHGADVQASLTAVSDAENGVGAESGPMLAQLGKVNDALGVNQGQLSEAVQKNRDMANATKEVASAASGASTAVNVMASQYDVSVKSIQDVQASTDKQAASHAAATLQMQMENDASGLLRNALDLLNGTAISAAQAQQSYDQQTQAMSQSVRDAKGNIDSAKTSIDGQSASAIQNRGSLIGLMQAAQSVSEATAQQTGSTEAGRAKFEEMKAAIVRNAEASGMNREAVQAFIDKLGQVPASVPPTRVDVDRSTLAEAQARVESFRATVASLQNRTVTVTTQNQTIDSGMYAGKQVGVGQAIGSIRANGVTAMANGAMNRGAFIASKPILMGEVPGLREAYIPINNSPRSKSLLAQTNSEMGNPLGAGQQSSQGPMQISGTLDLGNGLVGMVAGILQRSDEAVGMAMMAGG